MKFISLNEWLTLNEGGNAISVSRPINYNEAKLVHQFVIDNIITHLNISPNDIDLIGSFGKKKPGQLYGDLDLVVDSTALQQNNNLQNNEILDFVNTILNDLGYETKKMVGFNQVSTGIPIPNTSDIVQVDFMISPDLEWSKFIYHSPDFTKDESKYKGIYRNALLMAIITETSKNILKQNQEGQVEELESNVIRFAEGIFRSRRSFKGKKGIVKTAQLLKEYDKLVALNPQAVTELAVGDEYVPGDINTFEKLWDIINSNNYIFKAKLDEIITKFKGNLKSLGLEVPTEII